MTSQTNLPMPPGTAIHLVGVGGTGMSSLAAILWQAGYQVTGSDIAASPVIDALRASGIPITLGHDTANVSGCSLLVRSSAVPDSNPEIQHAKQLGIRVLLHCEMLGLFSQTRRTLAVSGTSGKTTTTAMLAMIVLAAGLDPTVLLGGVLPALGSGARMGNGDFFVVEADEWQRRFLELRPEIAVVTNVGADHLDYYSGGLPEIIEAFQTFVGMVPADGWNVLCADDPITARLAAANPANAVTYGLSETAEWRAVGLSKNDVGGNDFYVMAHDTLVGQFRLRVPGRHNVLDALAAAVAAGRAGVDFTTAASALEQFTGVQRRLELRGTVKGIRVVDDYAHNPVKIRASLAALREQHDGRVICLFQPHTYHRLHSLFDEFVQAFRDADLVVVTDVYAPVGRGPSTGERTAEDLAGAIIGTAARYGGNLQAATRQVAKTAQRGDLIVTMGAGDVTTAGARLLEIFANETEPA